MPAGRSPKYDNPEQMQSASDGLVLYTGNSLDSNEFKSEQELSNYIENNIELFCSNQLGDKYITHESDKSVIPSVRFGPRTRRVDLYVECESNIYIIELKNPTNLMENRQGIGQLLDYGREYQQTNKKLLLITTRFDINTAKTISHYNLPIDYIFMSKSQSLEYKGEQ